MKNTPFLQPSSDDPKRSSKERCRRYRLTPKGKQKKLANRAKLHRIRPAQRLIDPESDVFSHAVEMYRKACRRGDQRGADKWHEEVSRLAKQTPRFVCHYCKCQDEARRETCFCGCHRTPVL